MSSISYGLCRIYFGKPYFSDWMLFSAAPSLKYIFHPALRDHPKRQKTENRFFITLVKTNDNNLNQKSKFGKDYHEYQ